MPVYSYDYRDSLSTLRFGLTYSVDKMMTHELAAPSADIFVKLREEHDVVSAIEVKLNDDRSQAKARIDAVGDRFADLCNRLGKQVQILTADNRQHALYRLFFGDTTLGDHRKLLLAGNFERVRGWESDLNKVEHAALKPFLAELKPLLVALDEAITARDDVERALNVFRMVGERRQLFDKVNAARKQAYGQLSKLPFEHIGLPGNFADRFFTHRKRKKLSGVKPTKESVAAEIESLKAETAAQEKLLAEIVAEEAEAAEKEAANKAEALAIAALEKQTAEMLAQLAAKKAKLAASQGG